MKRLIGVLVAMALGGLTTAALAGDFHRGTTLFCQQCHVAHGSQQHGYSTGGTVFPDVVDGPHHYLLRQEPNELCLACHNENSSYPDVLGNNGGSSGGGSFLRQAGALNTDHAGYTTAPDGYDLIDGHTLWSTDMPPGNDGTYTPPAAGLECVSCHAQHGTSAYRNLLNRGSFTGKEITYAVGGNDLTMDVWEHSARGYSEGDVDFNEPDATQSKYALWCGTCHTDFHGTGANANMGQHAGDHSTADDYWVRHPVQDVDLGHTGTPSYVASLSQYQGRTNKVKMMSTSGDWTGGNGDLTPSCMSCHKGHGNKNAFGLIWMASTGTRSEQGVDGAVYKDLCRQCHSQGAD